MSVLPPGTDSTPRIRLDYGVLFVNMLALFVLTSGSSSAPQGQVGGRGARAGAAGATYGERS
jgi:hypothetical protein